MGANFPVNAIRPQPGPQEESRIHMRVDSCYPFPEMTNRHTHFCCVACNTCRHAVVNRVTFSAIDTVNRVRRDARLHVWVRPFNRFCSAVRAWGNDDSPMCFNIEVERQSSRYRVLPVFLEKSIMVRLLWCAASWPTPARLYWVNSRKYLTRTNKDVSAVTCHIPQSIAPLVVFASRSNGRNLSRSESREVPRLETACAGVSHAICY